MKKMLSTSLLLIPSIILAQAPKAALIGLSTHKNNVTYVGKIPAVAGAPLCLVPNGVNYSDSISYTLLRLKTDSILSLMGFDRLPDDSVIKTTAYNELARKIRQPYTYDATHPPLELPAKGFSYIPWSGLGKINYAKEFFEIPSHPDIIVAAYVDFDINNSTGTSIKDKDVNYVQVVCEVFIKAFDRKNKKVFKLSARFTQPHNINILHTDRSCWGMEFTEDISKYQLEALQGVLKKLDEELPGELKEVKEWMGKTK